MGNALSRGLTLGLAVLATVAPLAAETIELPAELPLGVDSRLIFELDDAELHLSGRATGLPALRARAAAAGESAGLEAISEGGSLTIRRAGGGDGGGPRLRLDVALGPGRSVRIVGADLTVRFKNPLPASSGGNAIRLALERSRADLSGARVSEIEASASSLVLGGTEGSLNLTLTGGSAQLQGHRGSLALEAAGADVTVAGHSGEIGCRLEGGSLEVSGGEGSFEGTAAEAQLTFDGWRGPVELGATGGVVDVLGAEHRDRWQIDGRGLGVVLDRVWGTVVATLAGGSLEGRNLSGSVEAVAGGGARLDLAEVVGGVTLALADGSEALLAGVAGSVDAEVTDARLEAERIDQLGLTGAGAYVAARQVARLDSVEMSASELQLDLRETGSDTTLTLRDAGYARVQLRQPCVVQLAAGDAADGLVEVTGCELRGPDQRVSRRQDVLEYGSPPSTLTVAAAPDTVVEIEGEP